jgi:hypothetical protein
VNWVVGSELPLWGANLQESNKSFQPIPLPEGRYFIATAVDAAIRRSSGGLAAQKGRAHPVFAFLAALGGMGISIAELCKMCGASIDDGPVLARCRIRYHCPLRLEHSYVVDGIIVSQMRKPSRRFGAADHIGLELNLRDDKGLCAEIAITMIMPKGTRA